MTSSTATWGQTAQNDILASLAEQSDERPLMGSRQRRLSKSDCQNLAVDVSTMHEKLLETGLVPATTTSAASAALEANNSSKGARYIRIVTDAR